MALFEAGGLPAFERHFAQVSKRLRYTVAVPARAYGDALSELATRERFAEAEEVGKKMLEHGPKNTWALSALAQVAGRKTMLERLSIRGECATQSGDSGARTLVGEYRFKGQLTKVTYQIADRKAAAARVR